MLEPKQIDNQTFEESSKSVRVSSILALTGYGKLITPPYTFSPNPVIGMGLVSINGIPNFNIKKLVAVINQTHGKLLYAAANPALHHNGYTDTDLYFLADTSDMSGTDDLQFIYEVDESKVVTISESEYIGEDIPEKVVMVGGRDEDGKVVPFTFDQDKLLVLAELLWPTGNEAVSLEATQVDIRGNTSNAANFLSVLTGQLPSMLGRRPSASSLSVTMSNDENGMALYTTGFVQGIQLGTVIGLSKGLATDKPSAAITTTTTTSIALPAGNAIVIAVNITAVSGVNPTYDLSLWESADGLNYYKIYDFVRMTGVSNSSCPPIQTTGRNYRLVETVGGTTPSFTRAIYRSDYVQNVGLIRQVIDRAINPNAVNSLTQTLAVEGTQKLYMMLLMAGGGSGQPTIALEGTEDLNSGWYSLGTTVVGQAGVVTLNTKDFACKFIRGRVTVAGVGSVLTSLTLKALS